MAKLLSELQFGGKDFPIVRRLLSVGADPNTAVAGHPGFENVTLAVVTMAHAPLVKLLIEAGAEVNSPPARFLGRTPFQAAAGSGSLEII